MKVVQLVPKESKPDIQNVLNALDHMRKRVESGEIIGFSAIGLTDDDQTYGWSAVVKPISRLRMSGALSSLLFHYHNGALG
jgi:hypothetical protein